ncbi:serine/threonine-protein kinase [Planobispora longispora]|uniref:Protein kinase domain-containing protein n=1 Tax=Planobispora longispora TaxID=28887 RepID=A0A8J3RT56_9ACTN|nr:serine/threonine-protein kinase [Planobispora longispora]GIH79134.1 hypothetical protein Plo01_55630 [Planobispora longispora]
MIPLRPGDPDRVGGYRLLGRLGAGGQGVVYLGLAADGSRVAVKVLHRLDDAAAVERFLAEGRILRRVASFCTARILDSGTEGPTPYLVGEYVEGVSLAATVAGHGPVTDPRLSRLAVGALAALAAIHRAGVVHLDFKPGNLLIGPDGPRVIDFGISRVLEATGSSGEIMGTPAFMAPEQFRDEAVGPPADLFAWAGTMVFAATGRPLFDGPSPAAILYGILHREPDLPPLPARLREVVAACLAKDPARRPTATEALLRLLGHSLPHRDLLDEASAIASRAGGARAGNRRRVPAGGASLAAAALLTGTVILYGRAESAPPSAPAPVPSAVPARSLKLPGTGVVLHEREEDPVRLGSYLAMGTGSRRAYARAPGGGFRLVAHDREPVASPDAGRVALITWSKFADGPDDHVTVAGAGDEVTVRTTRKPVGAWYPRWSRDGRKILLTALEGDGDDRRPRGFVIVEAGTRTATAVDVPADAGADAADGYFWSPDGAAVARASRTGVRFHAADGGLVRELRGIGEPATLGDPFSPSGKKIITHCPDDGTTLCAWDAATGQARGRFSAPSQIVYGWYDEEHVLLLDRSARPYRVIAIDRRGREVRRLADVPEADLNRWVPHFVR